MARAVLGKVVPKRHSTRLGIAGAAGLAALLGARHLAGRLGRHRPASHEDTVYPNPVYGNAPTYGYGALSLGGVPPQFHGMVRQASAKTAFLHELGEHWNSLDTDKKMMAGLGGTVALGSLLNAAAGGNTTGSALTGLGGLGLAAHGLSGGDVRRLPQIAGKITGAKPQAAATAPAPAARVPWFARYLKDDGGVKYRDLINTPDAELRPNVSRLSPQVRAQLLTKLKEYQPGLLHRSGAALMGINLNRQKARFEGMLGGQ